MINIFSNDHQTALKYLKNTKANLCNILVMARNFNIRDYNWDPSYSFHSIHSDSLFDIANSFDLELSVFTL